jgi:hypothetical protein
VVWWLGVALLALAAIFARPALAWEATAVPADGALRPGRPSLVWVAVVDDAWRPVGQGVSVAVERGEVGAPASVGAPPPSPGVTGWWVTAPAGSREANVWVTWEGKRKSVRLPVHVDPPSRMTVEPVGVTEASSGVLVLSVRGASLPPPGELQVDVSEGRVLAVDVAGGGLRVRVALPEDPLPRQVLVSVRDARRADVPVAVRVPVVARVALPVQTEPGARVWVRLGDEEQGPLVVGADGVARFSLIQRPEVRVARLRVEDALGNVTARDVPLETHLHAVAVASVDLASAQLGGAPAVWVAGLDERGDPWRSEPPRCRTPGLGEVLVLDVGPGVFGVVLPPAPGGAVWERRVRCEFADRAVTEVEVPGDRGVPTRLALRMYPDLLSSDFPVSDVQVALENGAGERVAIAGRLEVSARYGTVHLGAPQGPVARGEYRGQVAAEVGEDEIIARWFAPEGSGSAAAVALVGVDATPDRQLRLLVRVLDAARRPLSAAVVGAEVEGNTVQVATDAQGYARVELPVAGTSPFLTLTLTADERSSRFVVVGGTAAWAEPSPDLTATVQVRVDPGRVATAELSVTPAVLRPGRAAGAEVRARFLDRAGKIATDGLPTLRVSAGRLEPLPPDADGTLRWTLAPPAGFAARQIEIEAINDVLDVEATARLDVRPAPVDAFLGVDGGIHSNFGALTAGGLWVEGGGRIRLRRDEDEATLLPSRVFLVADVGWYGARERLAEGDATSGSVRMDVVPIGVRAQLRQEYPTGAFWIGLGGVVAPWWGSAELDGDAVARRVGVLRPGLSVEAGAGVRVLGGEVFVQLRGSTLTSQGTPASFSGAVGGLSGGVGYRLLFSGRRG